MSVANQNELVSILIPAYNYCFFEIALKSALSQTYQNIEIIVCDDSENSRIENLVKPHITNRLCYFKNERNLGFSGNFTKCFDKASGEYIKFLNDDDILHGNCVENMVRAFHTDEHDVKLVFSKRAIVDKDGRRQPDSPMNAPLSTIDTGIEGKELGDYILKHSNNYIGEPTTVMFRKSDVFIEEGKIFQFCGIDYHCLADLSLWLRLLSKGDAIYLKDELSSFRVHAGQEQKKLDVAVKCLTERYELLKQSSTLGFILDKEEKNTAIKSLLSILESALISGMLTGNYQFSIERIRDQVAAMKS